jgi:nicotinamidase-related amidase
MPVDPKRAPLADRPAAHATALLIIDMISTWDFPDAEKLAPGALTVAPRIAALKRRCERSAIPVIYVNDNRDRWRSEFRELAQEAAAASATGAALARWLTPTESDYSVLKPKHSAFYATPLDLLLRHLRVARLLITGVATDMCIAMSAAEARMRDYEVVVPRDCVATLSTARNARTVRALEEVHHLKTTVSTRIRFAPTRPGHGHGSPRTGRDGASR